MKYLLAVLSLLACNMASAQTDEESVKQVVTSAYVNGIQNLGDVEVIRKGFHPSFNMLRLVDNEVKPYSIAEWITAIEQKKKDGIKQPSAVGGKFIFVDITGNNAVAKLELYRESKLIFTDYLVLYKFTEGWRIVSKTFFRHPN
jgi:hypothetical protein